MGDVQGTPCPRASQILFQVEHRGVATEAEDITFEHWDVVVQRWDALDQYVPCTHCAQCVPCAQGRLLGVIRRKREGMTGTFKKPCNLSLSLLSLYDPCLFFLLRDPWQDHINQEIRTGFAKARQSLAEPRSSGDAGPGP